MSKTAIGHKLPVGDYFESQTPRLFKNSSPQLAFHRPGYKGYFQHKNRRYFCEVVGCIERRTGWCYGVWEYKTIPYTIDKRTQWWQFTYVVKILEN